MKRFVQWKCFALILLEEISDEMYLSNIVLIILVLIGMPNACFISTFLTLK